LIHYKVKIKKIISKIEHLKYKIKIKEKIYNNYIINYNYLKINYLHYNLIIISNQINQYNLITIIVVDIHQVY
jgi:hypothetical protein